MTEEQNLEKEAFKALVNASPSNPVTTIRALSIASKIIDKQFGQGTSKSNPELAVRLSETLMASLRNDEISKELYSIAQHTEANKIVLADAIKNMFPDVVNLSIPETISVETR